MDKAPDRYPVAKDPMVKRPDLDGRQPGGTRWWKMPEAASAEDPNAPLAQELFGCKDQIAANQVSRGRDWQLFSLMYLGQDVEAFLANVGVPAAVPGQSSTGQTFGPVINVSKAVCDTVIARISTDKPKVQFLSEGGDWSKQTKAKKLQKFTTGVFYEAKIYEVGPEVAHDAGIWGTGALKFYEEEGRIKCERVMVPELFVDDDDGQYGTPTQLAQRKYVPQDKLLDIYPDHAQDIILAPLSQQDQRASHSMTDQVETVEFWHLPSSDKAKDGRHIIAVQNCVLLDEPWTMRRFPFCFLRYDKAQQGFWGDGLMAAGRSLQSEINRSARRASEIIRRCSTSRYFIERSAHVQTSQIGNVPGLMINYTGRPPIIDHSDNVPPEIFQNIQTYIDRYYAIAGVNQMSSQGAVPVQLKSGRAIRAADDVGAQRFQVFANTYQAMFLDAADLCIKLARMIVERDGSFPVRVPGRKFLDSIDFGDIDLEDEEFSMKMWPVNLLPDSPAGKLETLTEMAQNGQLPQQLLFDALDFPDLEAITGPLNAPVEMVKWQIERMLERAEPVRGDWNLQDPEFCSQMVKFAIMDALVRGCPEENLDCAYTYLADAQAWIEQKAQKAAAMAAALAPKPPIPNAPPTGVPGQPPVADMRSTVPQAPPA